MGKVLKRILKIVITLVLLVVVVIGMYIAYLMITYNRIIDHYPVELSSNVTTVLSADKEYKAATYNIGFGAYTPD